MTQRGYKTDLDLQAAEGMIAALECRIMNLWDGLSQNFPAMQPELYRLWELHKADTKDIMDDLRQRKELE